MENAATDLIEVNTVSLDESLGDSKLEVITHLAGLLVSTGRAHDSGGVVDAVMAREDKAATGMKGGFAIPHCKAAAVDRPSLAFARLAEPVDFGAADGPADLVFMLAAPEGGGKEHLKMLSSLARALVRKDFVASLRQASSKEEVVQMIDGVLAAKKGASGSVAAGSAAGARGDEASTSTALRVVAVTACATGIAHTYMAADALTQTAKEMGIDFAVEPQGSSGTTPLTAEQIAAADAVIFATDVGVRDRGRFAGKPVVEVGVKKGIDEPEKLLEAARRAAKDPQAPRVSAVDSTEASGADGGRSSESVGRLVQRGVMTGVSYMIPFVAAGGLLLALGFLFGGYDVAFASTKIATTYSLWDLPGQLYVADGKLVDATASGATALSRSGMGL